jgi:hypothetical protein
MFSQYSTQFFLLAVFFVMVYAVVEVIKKFFQSLPDKWGKCCVDGLSPNASRWISFIVAYILAWTFDFRFTSMIFQTINGKGSSLPGHINYFICACLLFVGARWIYEQITAQYKNLTGKINEK